MNRIESMCSLLGLMLLLSMGCYAEARQGATEREAKRHLERAMELESTDDSRAEREYRLAIKARAGRYPEAQRKLSAFLTTQLRFEEATEVLKEYISQAFREDHSSDLELLSELERAETLQKRINGQKKPSLDDLLEFAVLVMKHARPEDGRPYAERALKLYPDSSKSNLLLARLLRPEESTQQLNLIRRAIELDPSDPEAHSQLGWFYFLPGRNTKGAIGEFRKALDLSNGQYADAWQGLGHVLVLVGSRKEAIEAYRNYLRTRKTPSPYDDVIKRKIEMLEKGP